MDELLNKLFLWGFKRNLWHIVVTPFDTERMKIILSGGSKIYDLLPAHQPSAAVLAQWARFSDGPGKWIDFICVRAERISIRLSVLFP